MGMVAVISVAGKLQQEDRETEVNMSHRARS